MTLRDELPVDHPLDRVHRIGAALCGLLLLDFGGYGRVSGGLKVRLPGR